MSSTRIAASILIRASRSSIARSARPQRCLNNTPRFSPLPRAAWAQVPIRWQSQQSSGVNTPYSFEQIQDLISKPSKQRILIDVREPSELQDSGRIPGALNIPVKSAPDAFFLPAEEFEDRFGFERPEKDIEVVFYCRAGVRSKAAATLARQAGWTQIGDYAGSWLDWEKNGGVVEKK